MTCGRTCGCCCARIRAATRWWSWSSCSIQTPGQRACGPGAATLVMMDPPAALGDVRLRSGQLYTTVLRLADPANRADPDAARAVGRAALAVAAATGGTCVDLLGFRVLQPDDLVMR